MFKGEIKKRATLNKVENGQIVTGTNTKKKGESKYYSTFEFSDKPVPFERSNSKYKYLVHLIVEGFTTIILQLLK